LSVDDDPPPDVKVSSGTITYFFAQHSFFHQAWTMQAAIGLLSQRRPRRLVLKSEGILLGPCFACPRRVIHVSHARNFSRMNIMFSFWSGV